MSDDKRVRQAHMRANVLIRFPSCQHIRYGIQEEGESPLKESSELVFRSMYCSSGNTRSGIVKMSKSRTVPGMTWQEQASGIPIISA